MNQQSVAAILGLLLLAPTAPAAAQQPPDVPQALARVASSETVTILDTDGRRLVGRITQVSPSGLTLVRRGQATSVPLQRVATDHDLGPEPKRGGHGRPHRRGHRRGRRSRPERHLRERRGRAVSPSSLALAGAGAASGAGIGWLGDRLRQSVVYAAPGAPREFASEMGVKFITDSRGGVTSPRRRRIVGRDVALGAWLRGERGPLSWDVETGNGRGASVDGRMLYVFGKGRFRPYGLAGAGYFETWRGLQSAHARYRGNPRASHRRAIQAQGFAPLVGGGVRVGVTPRISIRPQLLWYTQRVAAAFGATRERGRGVSLVEWRPWPSGPRLLHRQPGCFSGGISSCRQRHPAEARAGFRCERRRMGGERGIRTLGFVTFSHVFQACSFDHSNISPFRINHLRAVWHSVARNSSFKSSSSAIPDLGSSVYGSVHVIAPEIVSDLLLTFDHLRPVGLPRQETAHPTTRWPRRKAERIPAVTRYTRGC